MGPKSAQKLRQWHSGYESTQIKQLNQLLSTLREK